MIAYLAPERVPDGPRMVPISSPNDPRWSPDGPPMVPRWSPNAPQMVPQWPKTPAREKNKKWKINFRMFSRQTVETRTWTTQKRFWTAVSNQNFALRRGSYDRFTKLCWQNGFFEICEFSGQYGDWAENLTAPREKKSRPGNQTVASFQPRHRQNTHIT